MTDWNPNDPDATRVYYDLSAWTFDQQAELAATEPSFEGRRAFLVDGTTITLAPEPALQKAFPPASNQLGEAVFPTSSRRDSGRH